MFREFFEFVWVCPFEFCKAVFQCRSCGIFCFEYGSDVGFFLEVGEFFVEDFCAVCLCLLFWFAEPFF